MQKKILPIIASVLASASLLIALLLLLGDVHAEAAPTATDTTAVRLAAGVGLSPGYSQEAEPGTVVTYTHILTNTGTVTDTFRLGATNSRGWTVTLGGGDGPTSTLEVSGGATDTFTVSVAVPLTAMADITASTFITATSQVTPTALDTITDITTVTQIAGVELSPGYSRTVEPGTVATYTHVITNTGWSEATFHLTHHSSRNWTVEYVTPITLDGSLSGRNTTTLVVSVTVPPDAGGLTDETTITATGPLDALATATDTTVVSEGMRYIYLPLVMHNYMPNWSRGGLADHTVYQIAVCAADPNRLYAGTEAGVFRSANGGASWEPAGLQGVLVRGLDVAANDCGRVYAATWGQYVQRSTDGGVSWDPLSNGLPESHLYTVVVDASASPDRLYAGTAQNGVYQSLDSGASWEPIFNQPDAGVIARLTLVDSDALLVATWGGNAYRLAFIATTWHAIPLNVPEDNVFEVVQGNGGVLFAATDDCLYHYTGIGWEPVHDKRAYGVALDPDRAQVVYAATADGVWRSTDGGANFSRFGLDGQTVRDIAPGPQGSALLHAGTTAGAWRRTR